MTCAPFFLWALLQLPTANLPTETAQAHSPQPSALGLFEDEVKTLDAGMPLRPVGEDETPDKGAPALLLLPPGSLFLPTGEEVVEPLPYATQVPEAEAPAEKGAPWPSPPAVPSVEMTHMRFKMGEGLLLSSKDNASELRVRGMAQARASFLLEGVGGNEFSARGVRIFLEGKTLERRLVFSVHTSLGHDEFDAGSGLLDAWVSWKFGRDATLRVGQQRTFFDMASAVRRHELLGVTRENFSHEFGLLRDTGASLFSEDFLGLNELLGYRLGLYSGQGRNRFAWKRSGFLAMARLVLRPFGFFDDVGDGDLERLDRFRLAVGVSAAYSSNISRTGGHLSERFDSFAFPAMDAYHGNVDALLKWRGLFFAGQYTRRVTSKVFVENDTDRVWGRSGHGYVLKAGGMLSSQWELMGRWSQQFGIGRTDPTLLEQLKNEFAVGLNHYFIGHALKAQLEYSARFSNANVRYEDGLRLQLQVVF